MFLVIQDGSVFGRSTEGGSFTRFRFQEPLSDHLSGQRLLLLLIVRRALPFDPLHVLDIAIQLRGML